MNKLFCDACGTEIKRDNEIPKSLHFTYDPKTNDIIKLDIRVICTSLHTSKDVCKSCFIKRLSEEC